MGSSGASNTSALTFLGDETGSGGPTTDTEVWNGSTWTEVNDCNTGRYYVAGAGTATAALAVGGENAPTDNLTESWDGTNWTEVAATNTGHGHSGGLQGGGTNTSTLVFGAPPSSGVT